MRGQPDFVAFVEKVYELAEYEDSSEFLLL